MADDTPAQPPAAPTPPDLPGAAEEIARADPQPAPLFDFDAAHRQRFHEATVQEAETRAQQASDDRALREKIATWVSLAIGVQVGVADLVFLIYGFANDWHIPGSTMNAWLAATVVQVIAVGLVITRSLFPGQRK